MSVPDGLSRRSALVWKSETTRSKSPGRLLLLEQCLRAVDRADELRAIVDSQGLTSATKTTGTLHVHPLTKLEAEQRSLFVKLARVLHLAWRRNVDGGRDDRT